MNIDILKKLSSDLSVLVIEEDDLFLDLFSSTLSVLFKTLYRAKSEKEGKKLYFKNYPDVVMIDFAMSEKNKFALVREIREHSVLVPVIGLGRSATIKSITEGLIEGMDECLDESVEMEILTRTLYVHLRKYQIKNQIDQKDQFINTMLASTQIGIAVLDTNANFIECNDFYASMIGTSGAELISRSWIDTISDPSQKEQVSEVFQKVLNEGYVDSFRQMNRAGKGQNSILDVSLYLLPQKQKILMSVKDMTKEMDYLDELKKASKAKDVFLANMSHEIRTPLNGIIGILDIIRETSLNEKQEEYLKLVQSSSATLLNIINDILDYSKIEAGKFTLESYSFNPAEIIQNCARLFSYSAEKNGTTITSTIKFDDSLQLLGDGHRLSQILSNLVGNATKFTKNGSIKVVASAQEKMSKVWLNLRVVDTGIGMSKEHLHHLFTPFSQGDASNSREYGGTGLGLAICKELSILMGGDVSVESKVDSGSTFIVSIPFERSYELPDCEAKKSHDLKSFSAKGRVLVVDDNKTNLIVATEYLSRYGLEFETAENGAEAVERVESGNFDLVLMDVQMPIMDGHEATQQIRLFNTDIPIIGLSASAMKEDHALCLAMGMNDNVAKPIVPEKLEAVLAHFLPHEWKEKVLTDTIDKSCETEDSLYGIDMNEMRKKFRTDEKIKRYLKIFADENRHFGESMESVLSDYNEMHRLLHYLKGVSGNSSMPFLYEMCHRLYAEGTTEHYAQEIPLVVRELNTIIDSIDIFLKS